MILPQFSATPATIEAAPATIRPIPIGSPTPVTHRMIPSTRSAAPTAIPSSFKKPLTFSTRKFQLREAVAAKPTAPAAISPIPSGVATPVRARISPIPIKAPLTSATIAIIFSFTVPVRLSHLRATADTSDTAPAAISAIPRGVATPEKARIRPRAIKAPPTIAVMSAITSFNCFGILSQAKAAALAIEAAPRAMRAIPKGINAPDTTRITPRASNAPPMIPIRVAKTSVSFPSRNFQLIVAAVASETAPAAIKAIPRGTFAPEKVRNAPRTNKKPPRIPRQIERTFASCSLIPFQFSAITATSPIAPTAISPSPRGTFTPENTRIAPITRSAVQRTAIISLIASLIIPTISSTLDETRFPRKS